MGMMSRGFTEQVHVGGWGRIPLILSQPGGGLKFVSGKDRPQLHSDGKKIWIGHHGSNGLHTGPCGYFTGCMLGDHEGCLHGIQQATSKTQLQPPQQPPHHILESTSMWHGLQKWRTSAPEQQRTNNQPGGTQQRINFTIYLLHRPIVQQACHGVQVKDIPAGEQ